MAVRVLHLISNLKFGGAQVCLKYLVDNTEGDRFENFVCPLRSDRIDIPVKGKVIKLPYPNYDPRKFPAILRLCRKYRIDIIHAHLEKSIMAALPAGFFCKVPVIIHEHGPVFRTGWQHGVYRFILRLLGGRAAAVIAVSDATAKRLIEKTKIPPQRIRVIYNAVDRNLFKPDPPSRHQVRAELGVSERDVVIGFTGRLDHVKGPDLLIEAMGLLAKQSDRYFLVLLGDGPLRGDLEKRTHALGISDRVKFPGFVNDPHRIMNAFDIGVVCSRQESFGISALEMMAVGVPIVSSGVEGLAEITTDGRTALVTPENTPEHIHRCIEQLANDQTLRQRLIEAAREFVKDFGVDRYAEAFKQLYTQLTRQPAE